MQFGTVRLRKVNISEQCYPLLREKSESRRETVYVKARWLRFATKCIALLDFLHVEPLDDSQPRVITIRLLLNNLCTATRFSRCVQSNSQICFRCCAWAILEPNLHADSCVLRSAYAMMLLRAVPLDEQV